MDAQTERLLDELRDCGRKMPDELRDEILEAASAELVSALISLMRDTSAVHEHPQKESPPVHAAHLLARIDSEEATEALVEMVIDEGQVTALGEAATHALQAKGDAEGRGRLVSAYEAQDDREAEKRIAKCLAGFPEYDRRTSEILVEQLRRASGRSRSQILRELEKKASPEIVSEISEWFSGAELLPTRIPDRGVVQVAAATIEALGGELTERQRALVEEASGRTGK